MTTLSDPITLSKPVGTGDDAITALRLREPSTAELRGLKLTDVLQMDVTAMIRLIPRVASPYLGEDQVAALPPRDFMRLAGEVVGFFIDEDERKTRSPTT